MNRPSAPAQAPQAASGVDSEPLSFAAIYTLVLLCIINAFNFLDRGALALVLPQIKSDLKLSDTILGLISGLPFALCYALCAIPAAWIADRFSRRHLISIGLTVWSACTAASAAVTNGVQLAAARFLLGAGESTGLPASTSMIADLFSASRRGIAFSALAASPYLGVLVGFAAVGWVTDRFGWRAAFIAAGAPGLIIAVLFFFTVKEPSRRTLSGASVGADAPSFAESLSYLLRTPSFLLITFAGALSAVNFGSLFAWGPTFLARVHDLGPQEIGQVFGVMRGLAGLVGALTAGVVVRALIRRHALWQVWAPASMAILLFPSDAAFLFLPDSIGWKIALAFSAFLTAAIVAVTYVLYVNVAPTRMRATATALYFMIASLTGLTFGPLIVGLLNDYMAAQFGPAAIRYSMLIASFSSALCGIAILLAGRTWRRDVELAQDR